jgi:hypothetical protein
MRQPFLSTIAGDLWQPPTEAVKTLAILNKDLPPQIRLKVQGQESLRRQIEGKKYRLAELKKNPAAASPSGGGGRGRTQLPPSVDPKSGEAKEDPRKTALEGEIKKLEEQERKIVDELNVAGYADAMAFPPPSAPLASGRAILPAPEKPLMENPAIRIWSHDLTAKPGKTYRYRVRVAMNNPLFAKGTSLGSSQQTLATQPVSLGQASEWTAPVSVLDHRYIVVSGASDGMVGLGRVTASFEIFQFHYGYYRKGVAQLEAGDQFDATIVPNDPNRRPIFDLSKLKTPTGELVAIEFPPPVEEDPSNPAAPVVVPLPANSVAGPKELRVATPMYFLDASRVSSVTDQSGGRSGETVRVTLVNDQGQFVHQYPNRALTTDSLMKRIALSAKAGETQGELQQLKGPSDTLLPGLRRPKDESEKPGDDGGGGGGG